MEPIWMIAKRTFRGTNGYIPAGSQFYVTNPNTASMYAVQGVADYRDGQPAPQYEDLKELSKLQIQNTSKENINLQSMERNVTSMAKPVNIQFTEAGQEQGMEGNFQSNQEMQNQGYQNKQIQAQQNQQYQMQGQQEEVTNKHLSEEHHKQEQEVKELKKEVEELKHLVEALQSGGGSMQSQDQQKQQEEEQPVFEVRHLGNDVYELPNGERVQGKEEARNRVYELVESNQLGEEQSMGYQPKQVGGKSFPNQERVQQVNNPVQDGASLYANTQNQGGGLSGQSASENFNGNVVEGNQDGAQAGAQINAQGNNGNVGFSGGNQPNVTSQNNQGNQGGNMGGNARMFGSQGQTGGAGTSAGATGTSGVAGTGTNTGGGGTGTTGGTTGSTSGAGGTGGANTGGNTNQ